MKSLMNGNGWMYLFYPEDSTGAPQSNTLIKNANGPLGVVKVALWTGVSFLISMGISQLT